LALDREQIESEDIRSQAYSLYMHIDDALYERDKAIKNQEETQLTLVTT
jgi:hypothetical protein